MHKYGDGKRKQALSKVRVKVQPGGQHVPNLKVHARETGRVPVLLSATSLTTLGAVIIFETARTIFRKFEPKTVVQLELNPTGHWWMDLLEQMRVIIHDPETLFGQPNRGANGGAPNRGDRPSRATGLGTSIDRGVHSSRKEEHLARTRRESKAIKDTRKFELLRRSEPKDNTELRDLCMSLKIPLSGHETKLQLTKKIKEMQAEREPSRQAILNFGRH